MSYTPPSYNSVNFNFIGGSYSPNPYNSINFEFNPGPTVYLDSNGYQLTLNDISLRKASSYLPVSVNSYSLSYNSLSFIRSRVLPITSGIYTLNLYLSQDHPLVILNDFSTLSFNDIGLNKGPYYSLETISYSSTLTDISFNKVNKLAITSKSIRTEQGTLSNPIESSNFYGFSHSLSNDKTILVVSDTLYSDTESLQGVVYTYNLTGGEWVLVDTLISPTPKANGQFGSSLSLSGDGSVLVITELNSYVIYTYDFSGGTWILRDSLVNDSLIANGGGVGGVVCLSDDKSLLLVGNPSQTITYASQGVVYIYTLSGGTWVYSTQITPSSPQLSESFGGAIAISDDNLKMCVSSAGKSTSPFTYNGIVRTFEYTSSWAEIDQLSHPVPLNSEGFGYSLDLSGDGSVLVSTSLGYTDSSNQGRFSIFDWVTDRWIPRGDGYTSYVGTGEIIQDITLSDDGTYLVTSKLKNTGPATYTGYTSFHSIDSTGYYLPIYDTDINYGKTFVVDTSTFSLTYSDILYSLGHVFSDDVSNISLGLADIGLYWGKPLGYTAISYALAANAITLNKGATLPIGTGSYSVTLIPSVFTDRKILEISPLSLLADFVPVGRIFKESILPVSSQSYTLTYNSISTNRGFYSNVGSGSYILSVNAGLLGGYKIPVAYLGLSLSLSSIASNRAASLSITSSDYTLGIIDPGLISKKIINLGSLPITTSFNDITFLSELKVTFSTLSLNLESINTLIYNRIFTFNPLDLSNVFTSVDLIKNFSYKSSIKVYSTSQDNYLHISTRTPLVNIVTIPNQVVVGSSDTSLFVINNKG